MTRFAILMLLAFAVPVAADDALDAIYRAHAQAQGLDWKLVKAIAIVESNERADAVHAPSQSVGIVQVLCRDDGKGGCSNCLIGVAGWPPVTRAALFDPSFNVHIGAQILAWNLRTYGLRRGIAVYNNWSARHTPKGQPFPNEDYVQKVLRTHRALTNVPAAGGRNSGSIGGQPSSGYSSPVTISTSPR